MRRAYTPYVSGIILSTLLLVGCQSSRPPLTLADQIRGVGAGQAQGLQIYGLRNPIVTDLMANALVAEKNKAYQQALNYLDQALTIEPNAPDILQQRAEVKIEQGRWSEAKVDILQSIELGPRLGQLCQRNWRALALTYRQLGQYSEGGKAEARVPLCERTRPERF